MAKKYNEPKVQRVDFDLIEEFKNLNTEELPNVANTSYIITYDPSIQDFVYVEIFGGTNVTIMQAQLARDLIVTNTSLGIDLNAPFKIGDKFTDVIDSIINPKVGGVFSVSVSPNLVKVGPSHSISINDSFTRNDEGGIKSTNYFVDNSEIFGTTFTNASSIEAWTPVRVRMETDDTGGLPANVFEKTVQLRTVYPQFFGSTGNTDRDVGFPDFNNEILTDAATDKYIILDFPDLNIASASFLWFAVHTSRTPTGWAEIDDKGKEDAINNGDLPGLFIKQGASVTDQYGSIFYVYKVAEKTDFSKRIKIKLS